MAGEIGDHYGVPPLRSGNSGRTLSTGHECGDSSWSHGARCWSRAARW